MSNFKFTVEILSSLASLIAITTVLISWFKNSQKALKVERVVVHIKDDESTFILVVKNRKPYPVVIKSIDSYLQPRFTVEKFKNHPPDYRSILSLSDCVFCSSDNFEMAVNGHTDLRIKAATIKNDFDALIFSLHTSHGYHQLKCNKILNVAMSGKTQTFAVDYTKDFNSKNKAWFKYQWLKLKYAFKKS